MAKFCPFCGESALWHVKWEGMYHAQCQTCGALGPQVAPIDDHPTKHALAEWDRRTVGPIVNLDTLETGKYYWMRWRFENVWRVAYVFEGYDDKQWIDITNGEQRLSEIDLSLCDFVPLEEPPTIKHVSDGFGHTWPPCKKCGREMQIIRPGDARCPECEEK